jgi:hypothetical protein
VLNSDIDSYDYCAVAPRVTNFTINNQLGQIEIIGSGEVTASFNAVIDGSQAPLSSYKIFWGDDNVSVSRGTLRDRPNADAPYLFTHVYDYYTMVQRNQEQEQEARDLKCADGDDICKAQENNLRCGIVCSNQDGGYNQGAGCSKPGVAVGTNDDDCLAYQAGTCWLPDDRSVIASGSRWCTVKPRVQVTDNWGWCNGYLMATINTPIQGPGWDWGYFGAECRDWEKASQPFTKFIFVGE